VEPIGAALPEAMLADLVAARAARQPRAYAVNVESGERHLTGPESHQERFRKDRSGFEPDGQTFVAIHNPPLRLVVVGAAHIAQALIPMARLAGFDPVLIDPRGAFATEARFPGVQIHVDFPDEVLPEIRLDARCALVTLSHDPKIDDPAIEAALRADVAYLGCLGSTRTHAKRVERLAQRGFTQAQIARIHAPVGLDIGAVTPAEIAVAVLAEMVARLRKTS